MRRSIVVLTAMVLAIGWMAAPANAFTQRWAHLLGSSGDDNIVAAATDAANNIYVVGTTTGQLPDSPEGSLGNSSAFVASYSAAGTLRWAHELGAPDGTTLGTAVAVNATGAVFVVGASNVTVDGATPANHGGNDVFVARFTRAGDEQWVRMIGGASDDDAVGATTDAAGNLVVAGTTGGLPGAPSFRHEPAGYVMALSPKHMIVWTSLVGGTTPKLRTTIAGLTHDCDGNLYVDGTLRGAQQGAYVASLDASGAPRWNVSTGIAGPQESNASLAADCAGTLYYDGLTHQGVTRPAAPPDNFLAALGSDDGHAEWDAIGSLGPAPLVADPGHGMIYADGGSNVVGITVSASGDPSWYTTTISLTGGMSLEGETLDAAGRLDVVGSTFHGQPPAPETYAGGFFDGFVSQITDPAVFPD